MKTNILTKFLEFRKQSLRKEKEEDFWKECVLASLRSANSPYASIVCANSCVKDLQRKYEVFDNNYIKYLSELEYFLSLL